MTSDPSPASRNDWLSGLTVILAGIYPLAIAYGASAVLNSLDSWDVVATLAASITAGLLLYWALGAAIRDRQVRAQWLGIVLLLLGTYSITINSLRLWGADIHATNPVLGIVYVIVAVLIATLLVRPWRSGPRELTALATIAFLLVAGNTYRGLARLWAAPPGWVQSAEVLAYSSVEHQNAEKAPGRDIYYLVVDALGRADTLQAIYGVDTSAFVADLRASGFFVADHARSNYAHTILSFASFLNLDYLDAVADRVGRDSATPNALNYLIQHNGLMRLASRAGYRVIGLGTDFTPTRGFQEADVCECKQFGLSMFEQAVLEQTPLAAVRLDPLTYGAHRNRLLASLDALEQGFDSEQRSFVFAHILAPHPPFVFSADGTFRAPARPFTLADGSDYPGTKSEYLQGYGDQTQFVLARIRRIVHAILSRPGPKPVIIIHGDHGPGSRLQLNDAEKTDLDERFDIFAAYYLPEGRDQLYDSITPVNAIRVIANQYLGTRLTRLPDASYFSTPTRLYDFHRSFVQSPGVGK